MLTDRELDIMAVIWARGSATAAEVQEALDDVLAYNTVFTMLRILEEKGHARHEAEGRAFRYYARTARSTASRLILRRVVAKLFGGSLPLLISELMRECSLSPGELRELRAVLDKRLGARARK